MRVVLQRVTAAAVHVDGEEIARIDAGLVALVGVARGDGAADARALARRTARLRMFDGDGRGAERSVVDAGGAVLVVSQFTLLGDTRSGNRPSWSDAAAGEAAAALLDAYVEALVAEGARVERGCFGARMQVELVNDGPFTLVLESGSR